MTAKVETELLSPSQKRQSWLHAAEVALRERFLKLVGKPIPPDVRVSIGFPKGTRDGKHAIGQCWALDASTDKHSEIFISPELGHEGKGSVSGSIKILEVMTHEFVHAQVGNNAGHKKPFAIVATQMGLVGKMTATEPGPEFIEWGKELIAQIGTFPAGKLTNLERKKDGTRQMKCTCETCGYICRTTRKWIKQAGAPICPADNFQMTFEGPDEEGDDDE